MTAVSHIAVVDDEIDITRLLGNYLQVAGYRVSQLHTGHALLALMETDAPALVLLDVGLPGEDGFSIARQLREHWDCGLVIVTGRGDEQPLTHPTRANETTTGKTDNLRIAGFLPGSIAPGGAVIQPSN